MRVLPLLFLLAIPWPAVHGQAPAFEVASVRPDQHLAGPDYNNQIRFSPAGFTGRNVTLKRLIAEAYRLQLNQSAGPAWLDRDEYDIDARTAGASSKEQMDLMLQGLLAERFHLQQHSETRAMRVYALVVDKAGLKVHPADGEKTTPAGPGLHFRGELRRFADLLAVQFSIPTLNNPNEPARASGPPIPVIDKTGLTGVLDFSVDIRPELGTDSFTTWQRALQEQLGLRIESEKCDVEFLVVDDATRLPTEN